MRICHDKHSLLSQRKTCLVLSVATKTILSQAAPALVAAPANDRLHGKSLVGDREGHGAVAVAKMREENSRFVPCQPGEAPRKHDHYTVVFSFLE